MILKSLEAQNFRQFRDISLGFSTDPEKNVTVIHGQNGSGKTTLMNAFLWVLYEDLRSLENQDQLVNQGAFLETESGESVQIEVVLEFEHDDRHHTVTRRHTVQKRSEDDQTGQVIDEELTVEYLNERGEVVEPNTELRYIRQIIPRDLSDLFFFDGEYINDLSGIDNQGEIREAIRKMMGLTILDRSTDHLEWVEKQFRKELQNAGGEELQKLINKQENKEDEKDQIEQKLEDKKRKKTRIQEEINDISDVLEQLDETAELEEKRHNLQERISDLENHKESINSKLEGKLSKNGFLTYAMPAFKETAEDLDELREAGEIPSELSNEFVDDLLELGECICGRELVEGTPHYEEVKGYKSTVSADGLDQTAIKLISHFTQIETATEEFEKETDELIEERERVDEKINGLRGDVDDIEVKIEELTDDFDDYADETGIDWDAEDIQSPSDLQAARQEKEDEKSSVIEDIGKLKDKIETLEDDIEGLQEEIDAAESEKREANLARKRMQTAKAVRQDMEETYEGFQHTVRERANKRVSETFEDVITSDYEARITDDFGLKIYDPNYDQALPVNKSRGERQVASLSFIGSLVDIARERYEAEEDYKFFSGGIYPIVMDSPFGSLDNQHRRDVSETIPQLANQVIVLATDSQWEGPVKESMLDRIGRQFYLEFEQRGGAHGTPVTTIREEAIAAKEVQ
jgi:DNA sulfur modification protein DndD